MAYNITHSEYLSGMLRIDTETLSKLTLDYDDDLAEVNFLTEKQCRKERNKDSWDIVYPWWYGEFSGSCYDTLLEILEYCDGEAEILLVWEGGDKHTVLKVVDGVVTEGKAKIVFEEE